MVDLAALQSAGGLLAQARMRGDKEAEMAAEQLLAENRLRMRIYKAQGLITPEAAERLCALLREVAVA